MGLVEKKILELYSKGFGVNKIASSLKLKKNKIKEVIAKYNKEININDIEKEVAITESSNSGVQIVVQSEEQGVSQNVLQIVNDNYIKNNLSYLIEMIEDYKDKNIVKSDEKSIIIELPMEENKDFKTSMRVNQIVWNKFREFCKENKSYTQKDLISMALVEYIRKYK